MQVRITPTEANAGAGTKDREPTAAKFPDNDPAARGRKQESSKTPETPKERGERKSLAKEKEKERRQGKVASKEP